MISNLGMFFALSVVAVLFVIAAAWMEDIRPLWGALGVLAIACVFLVTGIIEDSKMIDQGKAAELKRLFGDQTVVIGKSEVDISLDHFTVDGKEGILICQRQPDLTEKCKAWMEVTPPVAQ